MFGLTKREQRWKAEQKAMEAAMPLIATCIVGLVQIRLAEIEKERAALPAPQPKPTERMG